MTILLFLVTVLAVSGLIYFGLQLLEFRKQAARLDAELVGLKTKYDSDVNQWKKYAATLKAENQRLSKWKGVADADGKAKEILQTASATLEKANADAAQLIGDAQEQATTLLATARTDASMVASEAKQQAKNLKEEAEAILSSATSKAVQAVDAADKKAKEIAGSAYDAMKNASLYERTVRAMKNIIEGYGDQYIIPGHSFLDDLAEDFGHTQAGQELKRARERTKLMIRNGTAAKCEYVEANRRDTAVNFVVDAFNGKVDSILSRVKHDNAGTLEQEIRDAFALVNFNGKAFRDARISEEYLAARLEELKWAAITQQLKLAEREEQRRIKEQIREEQRAQREYERAIRDAATEEEMLRKAMENAQQQIQQASAEQKAKYEQQLQELAEKLRQAEERNQRAISMAQQTKRGHVYIISNVGSFGEDVYKIGLTRRLEPSDRIRELGDSSVPFEFDVHALIFSEDAPALETQLHRQLVMVQVNKVNHRKEFFRVGLARIRDEFEKLGLTVKLTMTAEAREYHESLAVEKGIEANPAIREAWIRRQLEFEPVDIDVLEPAGAEEDELK